MPQPNTIFAIDPGASGAIARLENFSDGSQTLSVWDMPIAEEGHPAAAYMESILSGKSRTPSVCFIEEVWARPNQGSVSTFKFGMNYGMCIASAAIAGLPITLIKPNIWKPKLKLKSGGTKTEIKARAMERATQLMPGCEVMWPLKKNDGRAEAALIAIYGALAVGMPCNNIKPHMLNDEYI